MGPSKVTREVVPKIQSTMAKDGESAVACHYLRSFFERHPTDTLFCMLCKALLYDLALAALESLNKGLARG